MLNNFWKGASRAAGPHVIECRKPGRVLPKVGQTLLRQVWRWFSWGDRDNSWFIDSHFCLPWVYKDNNSQT